MRINRYIAASGLCSRRQADQMIQEGRVRVNGKLASPGQIIGPKDRVMADGKLLSPLPAGQEVILAFNKPPGITCTADPQRKDNIIDFINYPERIFTIGRLDRDSRGLILLTNDGKLAHRIMHSSFGHEKEYEVQVDKAVDESFLESMRQGVWIGGQKTLPCRAWKTGEKTFHLALKQGLNRQIRRMCQALGYQVLDLTRVRILHITLGSLPQGAYRELGHKEKEELLRLTDLD